MSALPTGWVEVDLMEVINLHDSIRIPLNKSERSSRVGPYPYYGANGLVDHIDDYLFDGEFVLLAEDGGNFDVPGKPVAYRVDGKFWVNNHAHIMSGKDAIPAAFILHWCNNWNWMPFVGGTTRLKLTQEGMRKVRFPLPPLAEQKRILAKLDALNAKSARARTELARIETLVSRYKQAVLSKAFSGELVAPKAEKGEPISDLVRRERERLLAGQRTRNTKGAAPNPDRKPVEISGLPKTWYVAPLEELCDPTRLIQYGILMPGPDVDSGVPYVKVMNIKGGFVELEKVRRTTLEIHQSYGRSALRQGDLLLTIRGTVGRVAITPAELEGGNITQDTVRIAVLSSMNPRYIYWYLQSQNVQQYFEANKKGVAVQGINVGDVRPMEVPVPPLEEQHEIVRRIESAFAKIDRLAKEAKRALELVGRLDEAILAKAFRGELLPQDVNDEPAEKLLERIRTERDAAPKARRGRRAKA